MYCVSSIVVHLCVNLFPYTCVCTVVVFFSTHMWYTHMYTAQSGLGVNRVLSRTSIFYRKMFLLDPNVELFFLLLDPNTELFVPLAVPRVPRLFPGNP